MNEMEGCFDANDCYVYLHMIYDLRYSGIRTSTMALLAAILYLAAAMRENSFSGPNFSGVIMLSGCSWLFRTVMTFASSFASAAFCRRGINLELSVPS